MNKKCRQKTNDKTVRARLFLILALLLSAALFAACVSLAVKDFENYTQAFNEASRVYSFEKSENGVAVINPDDVQIYFGVYNETAVKSAIDGDRGDSPFTLSVPAPEISVKSEGNVVVAPYSEAENAFTFTASYSHFLGASVYVPTDGYEWFVKENTVSDFEKLENSIYRDVTLGQGRAVGSYTVKAECAGKFAFMGQEYPTEKGKAEISFGITAGEFTVSLPDEPKYTYGDPLNENVLNGVLYNADGRWEFADGQSNIENKVLPAGNYTLKLDFVPNNASYNRVTNIDVSFTVSRRVVSVLIYDQSSDQGDALKELTFDRNVEGLASGDTVDDLHITLETDADKNGYGTYRIFGICDNPNYNVKFTNSDDPEGGSFSVDAKYIVKPKSIPSEKPDSSYPDMSADGNGATLPYNLAVSLVRVDDSVKPEGIAGELKDAFDVSAILRVTDAQGFTHTEDYDYSNGRIYVTISPVSGADCVAYMQNGEYKIAYFENGQARIAPDAASRIYFIKSVPPVPVSDYNAATIVLAVLIAVCLAAIIFIRRKYFGGFKNDKRA